MSFASQLKAWRGERAQPEAAAALGVPPRTYQNWEQGHREPRGLARAAVESVMFGIGRRRMVALLETNAAGRSRSKSNPEKRDTRPARRTGSKKRVTHEKAKTKAKK